MSVHIIIDGYNLIRQSNRYSALDERDIQWGRDTLIEDLAAYKRIKRHRISVVFDGTAAPSFSLRKDRLKGIDVLFSRQGETADTVIKKMATHAREKALVVTSDRDIVDHVESVGAAVISSPEFERKIEQAADMQYLGSGDESETGWVPTTKKKGPSRRLPKKKRRSRFKMNKL